MSSKLKFVQLQLLCLVMLSLWGLRHSYLAIMNLRKYEETTKKLAEWSKEVENQLHKTRTTQTSGALAIAASLIVSTVLLLVGSRLPAWFSFSASPATLVAVLFARNHIKNYWAPRDGKTVGVSIPLPNMEDYNEAQEKTQQLLEVLEWLEYSWVLTSVVAGIVGYS